MGGVGFDAEHVGEFAGVQTGAGGGDGQRLQQVRVQILQLGARPARDGLVDGTDARVEAGRAGGGERGDHTAADAAGLLMDVLGHRARHHHPQLAGERQDVGGAERAQVEDPAAARDRVGERA
ncbi:Uncharacterised protein [Mycobacteroides abscessus subsp. abscessus]|nr:Uncharacterised protein [Mycobacteroides abscessus subsp. abscessus]